MHARTAIFRPDPRRDGRHGLRLLVQRRVSGLPVVTGRGTIVGVVSEGDLLPCSGEQPARRSALAWLLDQDGRARPKLPARVVADVMSAPAVTVEPFWTIPGAANLMDDDREPSRPARQGGASASAKAAPQGRTAPARRESAPSRVGDPRCVHRISAPR